MRESTFTIQVVEYVKLNIHRKYIIIYPTSKEKSLVLNLNTKQLKMKTHLLLILFQVMEKIMSHF